MEKYIAFKCPFCHFHAGFRLGKSYLARCSTCTKVFHLIEINRKIANLCDEAERAQKIINR